MVCLVWGERFVGWAFVWFCTYKVETSTLARPGSCAEPRFRHKCPERHTRSLEFAHVQPAGGQTRGWLHCRPTCPTPSGDLQRRWDMIFRFVSSQRNWTWGVHLQLSPFPPTHGKTQLSHCPISCVVGPQGGEEGWIKHILEGFKYFQRNRVPSSEGWGFFPLEILVLWFVW